jgi:DNA-binding MarR family transcriptional regulator
MDDTESDTTTLNTPPPCAPAIPRDEEAPTPTIPQRSELPSDRHDLRILQSIRRIIRSVALYSKKLATEHGITSPQLVCLLKLADRGPLSVKGLASEVYLSPSTVVGIVDRLEARGLVRRDRSNGDRRLVLISVTAAGKELVTDAPSPLQDALAKSLRGLSDLERATIALSFERIVDLMEIRQVDASPILEASPNLDQP